MKKGFLNFFCLSSFLACCMLISCSEKKKDCTMHSVQKLNFLNRSINYKLHSISKFYFLSNLRTLTYYKGYYYNIDPEKRKLYQFTFKNTSNDSVDVYLSKNIDLSFNPVDFCFDKTDMYILSEEHSGKLFTCKNVFNKSDSIFLFDVSSLRLFHDNVFVLPNSRLNIFEGKFLTGRFANGNYNENGDGMKYFETFNLDQNKVIASYYDYYKYDEKNFFPSMDFPHKTDHDSISFTSIGFEKVIHVYNILSGKELNAVCADSKFINEINGIDNKDDDFQKSLNYLIGNSYYLDIIYDPLTKCYYRIAKHEQKVKDEKTLKLNKIENAQWSVLVFNDQLQFIDEVNIPPKKLNFLQHFTDDIGVHFASINSSLENVNDSILKFENLEIK